MSAFTRTAIRRLRIQGYRSIRALDLQDLPDLVVLHGPNGSGKSNLLQAAQLVLRAATLDQELPLGRPNAVKLSLRKADQELGLRADDFHFGVPPEIRVSIEIELGSKAAGLMDEAEPPGRLTAELVVQRPGENELRYWFERADLEGLSLRVTMPPADDDDSGQPELAEVRREILEIRAMLAEQETEYSEDRSSRLAKGVFSKRLSDQLRALQAQERAILISRDPDTYFVERLRTRMMPRLLQVSPAYRTPGMADDPEEALFRAILTEDPLKRMAAQRLGQRLAKAGLFGAGQHRIALIPVKSDIYNENQVRFNHPTHGELPLRNLGSGEQQLIYMLAQRVITPSPLSFLEEPEAHLHTSLMETLARVLLDSIADGDGPPDVDQLWIATHHHQFALALEYLDVRIVDGATVVKRQPRAKAAAHFFEPGPIWEALRQLASSTSDRNAVVFRGSEGQPVTASEILDSIETDPDQHVAREYARAMTEAMVLAMRQRAEKPA